MPFFLEVHVKGFNEIASRNDLAMFLKIPISKLTYILYVVNPDKCYHSFSIPKKSGGERIIDAPNDDLKPIQIKLSKCLWEYQQDIWKRNGITPNIAHAFQPGKSIFTNAKIHKNKRYVFNTDLKDFFGSFHFGRVRGFFNKNKEFMLPIEVATVIAQLVCYKGKLPQGAPTSPIITNMICSILDIHLLKVAKKYKLDYTRYADDMTFSTNDRHFIDNYSAFYQEIKQKIEYSGFEINEKKNRLQYKDSKQVVTGLVVNKKLSIDHNYYKQTRAMAHNLYTKGSFVLENGKTGTINQLEGRFSFINQVDEYNQNRLKRQKELNPTVQTDSRTFRTLNGRERQYKMFLFYKWFFSNDKPVIVTEGKTDVLYLKAALKSLNEHYTSLVVQNSPTEFKYNVTFLKRSRLLGCLFGVSKDGADSMKNLYRYFSSNNKSGFKNYYTYFCELTKRKSPNPVIFVFDNELSNKTKPLSKFVNCSEFKISDEKKDELKRDCYVRLNKDNPVYLVTNPLVDEKSESEIEDLFEKSVLETELSGKHFSRKDDFDTTKYYSKDIFSKYVYSNYKTIDFSGFKPLLDAIAKSIESYSHEK